MRKQWTATALVMALGFAAPVFAQEDPIPPQNDPTRQQTPPDSGMDRGAPGPAERGSSADRERSAQQASAGNGEEYVVQKGDTLSALAERFLGSAGQWKEIADANGIQNPDKISQGMKLSIPQGSSSAQPASRSSTGRGAAGTTDQGNTDRGSMDEGTTGRRESRPGTTDQGQGNRPTSPPSSGSGSTSGSSGAGAGSTPGSSGGREDR